MKKTEQIPLIFERRESNDILKRAENLNSAIQKRRSVRFFSDKAVPRSIIEKLIEIASSAPSGAHKQPWTFCAISNPAIKKKIREAAEKEEYDNYHGRMSDSWLKDLEPFETDWQKPFLEIAPWLVVIFKKAFDYEGSEKKKNYYVNESVGIAAGFMISAIHQVGLATLTHTPSPMAFLQKILHRPDNERPFLLLPVGYPTEDCTVPDIERKTVEQVSQWYE